jgi:triphosphatase
MVTNRVSTRSGAVGSIAADMSETQNSLISPSRPAVKARPLSLPGDASLDTAIELALTSCLDHFVANWPTQNSPTASEGVHQMRVALRRLRAGVGLLKRALQSKELETAAARAKQIAAKLGEARDLDVFSDNLQTGPFARLLGEPSFYALLDAVECRRRKAHERVRTLIEHRQTRQFVNDLRATLTKRAWTSKNADATHMILASDAAGSARRFAELALDRLHRRAIKKCHGLAARSEEERHLARIALKKTRYAAEFFRSLFEEEEDAHAYIRGVTKIQDQLGLANDIATATRLLEEIDAANRSETAYAAGFVRGWHAHAQETAASGAGKSEKALKKLEPFWR